MPGNELLIDRAFAITASWNALGAAVGAFSTRPKPPRSIALSR